MKLCKDCKYYKRFWLNKEISQCTSPNRRIEYSRITGKSEYEKTYCSIARMDSYHTPSCGTEAKWFEPK